MNLGRRVNALEAGQHSELSPAVKQWLGWPLTDAEREALASQPPLDLDAIDTTGLSQEMKAWLGVE